MQKFSALLPLVESRAATPKTSK